jgi:hypothetical protein
LHLASPALIVPGSTEKQWPSMSCCVLLVAAAGRGFYQASSTPGNNNLACFRFVRRQYTSASARCVRQQSQEGPAHYEW